MHGFTFPENLKIVSDGIVDGDGGQVDSTAVSLKYVQKAWIVVHTFCEENAEQLVITPQRDTDVAFGDPQPLGHDVSIWHCGNLTADPENLAREDNDVDFTTTDNDLPQLTVFQIDPAAIATDAAGVQYTALRVNIREAVADNITALNYVCVTYYLGMRYPSAGLQSVLVD
jgi:hypothetical protein